MFIKGERVLIKGLYMGSPFSQEGEILVAQHDYVSAKTLNGAYVNGKIKNNKVECPNLAMISGDIWRDITIEHFPTSIRFIRGD